MRPFTSTLPLAEALAILREAARPVERIESVSLDAAAGRVLAEDIVAPHDVPPFDRAAMDGYAVRAADLERASAATPLRLTQIGAAAAGTADAPEVTPGQCVTIATGAPLPPGADAVVMVEDTTAMRGGRDIEFRAPARPRQHVGARGADLRAGDAVLRTGDLLTPPRVGVLAAIGTPAATVFVRPRVFLASSGNEVVPPGTPLQAAQIHDVNRFTLPAIVTAHGGEPVTRPAVRDTPVALRDALDAAAGCDLVVISGGSSVGDHDLLGEVAGERGQVLFHGIAVKPGKPTLLARLGERQLLLGMPGNPTSCLSNAYILLIPLLRASARLPAWRPETLRLRLSASVTSAPGRHQFYPVRIEGEAAVPVFKGSGEITSLGRADGYFEIPAEVEAVPEGTDVTVVRF
jgi:molybdenum cofactor synthesis domain-containing protein